MLRAISAGLLLIAATSCLAADFDVDALYQKWKEEDSRTLEGWRILDDPTLIEKLGPLGADIGPDNGFVFVGDPQANYLLYMAYRHGVGGAPKDIERANRYWTASTQFLEKDIYAELRPKFWVSYSGGVFEFEFPESDWLFSEDWKLLKAQADDGNAACQLLMTVHSDKDLTDEENVKKRNSWLTLAVEGGCIPAMAILGQLKIRGTEFERDKKGGLELLERAAKAGHISSIHELARFYAYPNGQKPSLSKCREWLTMAADSGDIWAMRELEALPDVELEELSLDELYSRYVDRWLAPIKTDARNNSTILTTPPNPVLCSYQHVAQWLKPMVEDNDELDEAQLSRARVMYAECLLHGIGGADRDVKLAMHWLYQLIRDETFPPAGVLYAEAKVIEQGNFNALGQLRDAILAEFRPAVRIQCGVALENLAVDYSQLGEARLYLSVKEAVGTLTSFAEAGDVQSMRMLIAHRSTGAVDWLRWATEAANLGDGESAIALFHYYREDQHADEARAKIALQVALTHPASREEALLYSSWYEHEPQRKRCDELVKELEEVLTRDASPVAFLAEHAWIAGVAEMGGGVPYDLCLMYGHGITRDYQVARQYLKDRSDDPVASFLLAQMMEQGLGAEPDRRGAVWVYEAVAEAGGVYAMHRLGELKLEDNDETKAAEWFKKAAEGGCLPSMVALAKAYHDGAGVDKDAAKAKEWAKKAADAGNEAAKKLLEEWKS